MSDASDVQHHLEEGMLLFSRGMVFEARQAWRKALHVDPGNPFGLDYLDSSTCELNPYDRQRESELSREEEEATIQVVGGGWDGDEYEVIAAGPAEDSSSGVAATGFTMAEDEEELGEDAIPDAPTVEMGSAEDDFEVYGADGDVVEAAAAEDDEYWDDLADEDTDWMTRSEYEAAEDAEGDEDVTANEEDMEDDGVAEGIVVPPEEVPIADSEEGDDWEPLAWVGEETPAVPAMAKDGSQPRGRLERAPEGELGGPDDPTDVDSQASRRQTPSDTVPETISSDDLVKQAGEELLDGRPEAARTMLQKVLQEKPDHKQAQKYLKRVDKELRSHYEDVLGDPEGVPVLNRPLAELFTLDLDPVGGYILSRIDGILTLDDLFTLSAHINPLDLSRILVELIESGVVSIRR